MRIQQKFNGDSLFFISDLHYGHENILKFTDRPFETIDENNKYLIKSLQIYTKPGDTIIDLGDMFWKKSQKEIDDIFSQIPDRNFIKILGNHDNYDVLRTTKTFMHTQLYDLLDITVKFNGADYKLVLSHYPILSWAGKGQGSLHLFGHCHGNIDDTFVNKSEELMVDVGVDGGLSKKVGTFVLSFSDIHKHFWDKTGGIDFRTWAKNKYKIL